MAINNLDGNKSVGVPAGGLESGGGGVYLKWRLAAQPGVDVTFLLWLLPSVFECAYAQLVLPWYSVPEPLHLQPLHRALGREVDVLIGRIVERGRHFDVCQAVVGSIRILTQHLHEAKQPDR